MIFRDRAHAARLLAGMLAEYRGRNALILAIPRGAVPMGRVLADALGAELDVALVRKLGAPGQPELAVGAVDEDGHYFLNEVARFTGAGERYVEAECDRQGALLRARRALYTPNRAPISPTGRIVIVLDDGIATGATMIAALRATRRKHPLELIAAAAVMPPETFDRIEQEADRAVCLHMPEWFGAVGEFFEDFSQVSDEEVIAVLGGARQSASVSFASRAEAAGTSAPSSSV